MRFIIAYVKSMRLYYAFITGIAGWLGVVYYEYVTQISLDIFKKYIIIIILFLSWGINQIINDYLGLKEDRINAPQRPMVTGELDSNKAVITSCILLLISMGIIYIYLEPLAVIFALTGVLLNVLYEYAKGYGIWGNIVFGVMIAMSFVVGFFASGPVQYNYLTGIFPALFCLVSVMNSVMTYYTYFKDYKGDMATGKKTMVVKYGLPKARIIAVVLSFIPLIAFLFIYFLGIREIGINQYFVFLSIVTLVIQLWTGYLYYKYPQGEKTYYSLSSNFRACSCGQATLIALFSPGLAMVLYIATYVFVGLLFDLYGNSKA